MQSLSMSANPSISSNWFAACFSRTCHFRFKENFNIFHFTRASSSQIINFVITSFDTPPRSVFVQAKQLSNRTSILPNAWHTLPTSSSEIIGSASVRALIAATSVGNWYGTLVCCGKTSTVLIACSALVLFVHTH